MKDKDVDVDFTSSPVDTKVSRMLVSPWGRMVRALLDRHCKEGGFNIGRVPLSNWMVEISVFPKEKIKESPKDMKEHPRHLNDRRLQDTRLRGTMDAIAHYLAHNPKGFLPTDNTQATFPLFTLHTADNKNRVYVDTPTTLIRVTLRPLNRTSDTYDAWAVVSLQTLHQLIKDRNKEDRGQVIEHVLTTIESASVLITGKPQSTLVDGEELWRTVGSRDEWVTERGEFGFRTLSNETLKRACEVLSEDEIEDWYNAVERIALG